jgi:hypothetical protein
VQKQAHQAYSMWLRDPWHPNLQFKQIHPTLPIFSARVGSDWRAVCRRSGNAAIWYFIGSHADYERLIATMYD